MFSFLKRKIKNEGDIFLCKDKNTGEPIIVSWEDRFQNNLVIGPTGSGKVSQVVFPTINQDIQLKERGMTFISPILDFSDRVYAMAKYYNRRVTYFNPLAKNCPSFNPLIGTEKDVIQIITNSFKMIDKTLPKEELEFSLELLENSLIVLKKLKKNDLNLLDLLNFIENKEGIALDMVNEYSFSASTQRIVEWFNECYFPLCSDFIEHSRLVQELRNLTNNEYLKDILIPDNSRETLDFNKHLQNSEVLVISTANGNLRKSAIFLGQLI